MNTLRHLSENPLRKVAAFAASVLLLATAASALPTVTITTANGSGADAHVSGWAAGVVQDIGTNNNSGLWCRKALATENQVVALRFDLTSNPRAGYTTFSLDFINYRTNTTPKTLAFYAVKDGAVGEDNNGSTPGYTDNNWDESTILFSTMPGLHWANTSTTDQGPNADAIYLGSINASVMATNRGQINSFRSAVLNDFMLTNADDVVTFLIVGANESEAGSNYLIRVSSEELTALDLGAPTNVIGTFAPRVVYDPPASCVDPLILQNPANVSANVGGTATFTAWFGSDASTTFQWQSSADSGTTWTNISGSISTAFTTPTLAGADTGRQYRCIASGCSTSVTNTAATLTVLGTDIWIGAASGGEWNTGPWSLGAPPSGSTITAVIGKNTNVSYNLPMAAASFGRLTNSGTLTVNTNGFVINAAGSGVPLYIQTNGVLNITAGGVVTITNSGSVTMLSPSTVGASSTINITGGTLIVTNSGTFNMGEGANSDNNVGAVITNSGGNVFIGSQLAVRSRDSRLYMSGGTFNTPAGLNLNVSANDLRQFFRFAGGTANLGNITVARATTAGGVSVEGAVVNSSSIRIGNNIAAGNSRMTGGVWTNAGQFYISDRNNAATSNDRRVFFTMSGGDLSTLGSEGIVINNQGQSSTVGLHTNGGLLVISGGTITAEGIYLNGPSVTANSWARFQMSGGTIYLGTVGLVANADSGNSLTAEFILTGGTLAAKDNWSSSANLPIGANATLTFKAADATGAARNITLGGIISGASGSLLKTGAGTLTLNAADTYGGNTIINAGTLALGASGSLNNSSQIIVSSGTVFDVSLATGYTLPAAKSLVGFGAVAGDVNFASAAILNPGTNIVTGTLTFSNSITQTGGAVNHFDLSANPSGPNNDLVIVGGDITVSGVSNMVEIVGAGTGGSVHPLFKYSGTFNGDLANNFAVVGPSGYLTNITTTTPKSISFVVTSTVRSATNIVWVGNATTNYWDVLATTNWLNSSSLDFFVTGDAVTFNNTGLANPTVDITASAQPSSVLVAASGDYTFTGAGSIGGLGGITKTNAGRLTIQSTNSFEGGVNIRQGTVSIASLEPDGTPSPLGKTGTLLVDGGALEYTGPSTSWTRLLSVGSSGGTISLPSGSDLTYSGTISGGSLTKSDLGTLTLGTANSYSNGTYLNGGTLVLANASGAGSGNIGFTGDSTLSLGAVKPVNTIVLSNHTGLVTGGNAGGSTGIRNIVGSSNLVVAVTTGVFDLFGDVSAYSGTMTLSNLGGSIVRFNGATGSKLATWDLGSGTMELNLRTSASPCYFGALMGGPNTSLVGRSASDNNGPTTYHIGDNGLSTTFEGIIKNGSLANQILSIVKVGSGTLTLSGASTHTGTTTISNGVLALAFIGTDGSIDGSTNINVVAGAVLDVTGRSDGTLQLGGSQTLMGNGTVRGSLNASGTVSPGASIGTLTVTNVVALGGTAFMELNTTNGVQTNDVLVGQAGITLGGTLTVTNVGPALVANQRFVLFSGPVSGSFGAVNLPTGEINGTTYTWTDNLSTDGSITVATVVTPVDTNPTNIISSVSGANLTLSWPASHTGWTLQTQTNARSIGLSTNTWHDVSGSDTTNQVIIPMNKVDPTVFYRLRLPQ